MKIDTTWILKNIKYDTHCDKHNVDYFHFGNCHKCLLEEFKKNKLQFNKKNFTIKNNGRNNRIKNR